MTFNMFIALKYPVESDCCFKVDTEDAITSTQVDHSDPLEASLLQEEMSDMDEEVKNYVQWMDAFKPNIRKYFKPLGENSSRAVPRVEKPPQLE